MSANDSAAVTDKERAAPSSPTRKQRQGHAGTVSGVGSTWTINGRLGVGGDPTSGGFGYPVERLERPLGMWIWRIGYCDGSVRFVRDDEAME